MATIPLSESLNHVSDVSSPTGSESFVVVQNALGKKATAANAKTILNLAGTNSGDQTIVLTGDVTGSGTGSFAATITDNAVTLAKQADIATDRLLGRDTIGTGDPEALTVGGGIEFSGAGGIQRSALTGDVTASAGNNSTTIANDVVTFAKIQNITTDRLVGRDTASSGDPEEISVSGGLEFSGSGGIQRSALTGDATASAGSNAITVVTAPLPRGYLAGLKLANNVSDATNDIDIAVGECRDSTHAQNLVLASALTKRLDASWAVGTNQGGLDAGSIANTTYHVWLIKRSDTGVVDALFSTSATAPTMPANYDYKRRIGSIMREAAAIVLFTQYGDRFRRRLLAFDVNAVNPGTSAVTVALSVPTGIIVIADFFSQISPGTSSVIHALVTALDETDSVPASSLKNAGAGTNINARDGQSMLIKTDTSAQIRYRLSASGASDTFNLYTCGWIDIRGRDD